MYKLFFQKPIVDNLKFKFKDIKIKLGERNMDTKEKILMAASEASLLGVLKKFYEQNNDVKSKQRLRNILARATNKSKAISAMISKEMNIDLTDQETERMSLLIEAFLNKSLYREKIPIQVKIDLLEKQEYKCRYCEQEIDITAHADHIVPFKYVGDELQDNLQMLCARCNESKNASIDYEIRYLLHIV